MATFSIQTLGCKVNQYESEQVAALLRSQGWVETESDEADLRIVNTCSVTMEAASKSRQAIRRAAGKSDSKVVAMGCWTTSDKESATRMNGVNMVLTHHDDVNARLSQFLAEGDFAQRRSLPVLEGRPPRHQRAFLKIQDGCDAHCTYCIIPKLRPLLWSKPIDELVDEARRLVNAGHVEIVLTGIFLGAYGKETALRRRQLDSSSPPLAQAINALCTRVPGLRRVRLSSLEPGDLDDELLAVLRSHSQVVPHFHLPLQSGSSAILRKMNRQYSRDDFLRLIDRLYNAFDRPVLTTDIIVGFPGETDDAFAETLEIVERARFIHIHAFPFSPRPGTAAARWRRDFVRGPVVSERIDLLRNRACEFSLAMRSTFVDQIVQLLVEEQSLHATCATRHGRCERYFDVHFEGENVSTGDFVNVRIDRVTPTRTFGRLQSIELKRPELVSR
jgi:threonylcarbamoyladenosine tRNA methylthiotransferase MtaB